MKQTNPHPIPPAHRPPTAAEIIDRLGGTTKVANMFKIRRPSVSQWRAGGIPAARLHFITVVHPTALEPIAESGVPDPHQPGHRDGTRLPGHDAAGSA